MKMRHSQALYTSALLLAVRFCLICLTWRLLVLANVCKNDECSRSSCAAVPDHWAAGRRRCHARAVRTVFSHPPYAICSEICDHSVVLIDRTRK